MDAEGSSRAMELFKLPLGSKESLGGCWGGCEVPLILAYFGFVFSRLWRIWEMVFNRFWEIGQIDGPLKIEK